MPLLSRLCAYPLLVATGETRRLSYLKEFRNTQYLSPDELRCLQLLRLKDLLNHAYSTCPFYRSRLDREGFNQRDYSRKSGIEELAKLLGSIPPLTKSMIQKHSSELMSKAIPAGQSTRNQTGGSTGQPISFLVDDEREESRCAAELRHDEWAGLSIGDRRAVIWGAPLDLPSMKLRSKFRRWLLGPTLWLDTGNLSKKKMLDFDQRLKRFRPKVFVAYANAIVLLAEFYKAQGIQPYSPHSIITSAEVLTPTGRSVVEQVFQAPVFNRYGCREVSVIASECEKHDGMHVMAEGLLVEILNDGRPVAAGEVGEIVVTDLLNRAMPLIRYKIGDIGTWAEGACSCGRSLPRLKSLDGRNTDFVVSSTGKIVSGVFLATYVLAARPSLGQVQLHQSEAGKVLYKICPAAGFSRDSDLDFLRQATLQHVGEDTKVQFEVTDQIPAEQSGKYRFCKSTVNPFALLQANDSPNP